MGTTHFVQTNDNDRLEVEKDGEYFTFEFSNSVPGGAIITSLVIHVVHHEESGFNAGDLEFIVESTSTLPPISPSETDITFDWDVTSIADLNDIDSLQLRIENNGNDKKAKIDYIYADVNWLE